MLLQHTIVVFSWSVSVPGDVIVQDPAPESGSSHRRIKPALSRNERIVAGELLPNVRPGMPLVQQQNQPCTTRFFSQ